MELRASLAGMMTLLSLGACSPTRPLTDAEKLERVREMVAELRAEHPGIPAIDPRELRELAAANRVVLVDAREDEEREISMLPGALSRAEFEALADELGGRVVVTYCTIGYRSGLYTQELRARGLDAYNLEGSILAWLHDGGEVVDASGPTNRVHVYGPRWDLAPNGYETEW